MTQFLAAIVGNTPAAVAITAVLTFVFLDVALAVAAAIKAKTFQVAHLADFVGGDLAKALVVIAFGFVAQSNAAIATVFYSSAAALLATLAGKINANATALFGLNPHITPPPIGPVTPPTA